MTTTAERVANNAVLTAVMRGVVLIGVPALLGIGAWMLLAVLAIKDEQTRQAGQIATLEVRLTGRMTAIEDRASVQSARLRDQDAKNDALAEKVLQITVQVAVLVEQIKALIAANQRVPPSR